MTPHPVVEELKKMDAIPIRGHHLGSLAVNLYSIRKDGMERWEKEQEKICIEAGYDAKTTRRQIEIYKYLYNNPDSVLEIVKGLDFLCIECNRFNEECLKKPDDFDSDSRALKKFKLEIGKRYRLGDINELWGLAPKTEDYV
jgi:hypothetical protein